MSTLNVDALVGNTSANAITVRGEGTATTSLQQGLCKAWFVFDQVNSNTLDDSFNIGSMTDRGTGSMYGNFTNNMNSLHYTSVSITSPVASGSMVSNNTNRSVIASADTTARNGMNVYGTDNLALLDEENVQSNVHGDLA
tara:strand:- start:26 stop:445 length:420 start_codon:yes stop_codon:yes gene_type:complete